MRNLASVRVCECESECAGLSISASISVLPRLIQRYGHSSYIDFWAPVQGLSATLCWRGTGGTGVWVGSTWVNGRVGGGALSVEQCGSRCIGIRK